MDDTTGVLLQTGRAFAAAGSELDGVLGDFGDGSWGGRPTANRFVAKQHV